MIVTEITKKLQFLKKQLLERSLNIEITELLTSRKYIDRLLSHEIYEQERDAEYHITELVTIGERFLSENKYYYKIEDNF
jgi:hypothetical protein